MVYEGAYSDGIERINALIKEIVKLRYIDDVLQYKAIDDLFYDQRMETLRKLEVIYTNSSNCYSPTSYQGFDEDKARWAYGKKEWEEIKNTLDFVYMEVDKCNWE